MVSYPHEQRKQPSSLPAGHSWLLQPQQKQGPLLLFLGKQASLPGTTLVLLMCTLPILRASLCQPSQDSLPTTRSKTNPMRRHVPSSAAQWPIDCPIPKKEELTLILLLPGWGERSGPQSIQLFPASDTVTDPSMVYAIHLKPRRRKTPRGISGVEVGRLTLLAWTRGHSLVPFLAGSWHLSSLS